MSATDPCVVLLTPSSCGFNVTNLQITSSLGCVQRGFQWQVPRDYFGFPLPDDISKNISKAAVTSVVGECSLYPRPQYLPSIPLTLVTC